MTQEIQNARIESTFLGEEDHGILTGILQFDFGGIHCGWGMYSFGSASKPVESAFGMEFVRQVLNVVGVDSWEKVAGKYIRCRYKEGTKGGWGASSSNIEAIGHIVEDRWFNIQETCDAMKASG